MIHRDDVIGQDEDILGGTPVFRGTRVPIKTLLDYLEAGDRVSDFLEDFPTVSQELALRFLELTRQELLDHPKKAAA